MEQADDVLLLLTPYRVLDLTDEKGFLCGKVLADLGADVIKIEPPGGDPARNIGSFYHNIPDPEKSLYWFSYNIAKRGITLNIGTIEGQQIFKQLVKSAHFVVESFSPGYMDKLGLGYSQLSKINPGIIYTSITPFGQTGPYKDYKASDIVAMAMGGLSYIYGYPDLPPIRFSVDQAYAQVSLQAACGALIANYYRDLTGEGQHLDVSMQESIVSTLFHVLPGWDLNRTNAKRIGPAVTRVGDVKRTNSFPCRDGYVAWQIFTGQQGMFTQGIIEMMDEEGIEHNLKDIDWTNADMNYVGQQQIDDWEATLGRYFATHTKAQLQEKSVERGNMVAPINTVADIAQDKQLTARGFWADISYPELGVSICHPGPPFKLNETSVKGQRRAPLIGEHNKEIFEQELGYSSKELLTLKQAKVI